MIPTSVAMTEDTARQLSSHLLRRDGQEDICLALYRVSTGRLRRRMLVSSPVLPECGERAVHGNASFTGAYVTRAAALAAEEHAGLVVMHSHPSGAGWQRMSAPDADAEQSYAYLVHELTGLPLVGMTLAGDGKWSARAWSAQGVAHWAESVATLGTGLDMSFNEDARPSHRPSGTQIRTVSGWGERMHCDIARLRVLVVGLGSVGLDVATRLAATGIETIGLMDFDRVEFLNLDRLVGATAMDALLGRTKVEVASRLVSQAATASSFNLVGHDLSICEPAGLATALDYDVIISCVDRPWARAVLNTIAYSDLIPVIDGGIHIDAFPDGGMRGATWRTHVLRPGRPCLVCNGQLDPSLVPLDREGLLDDPTYIAESGIQAPARQNVAALSASVSASVLALFVSLVASPGGCGEPGPLQYVLATHTLGVVASESGAHCAFEARVAAGDRRPRLVKDHQAADLARVRGTGRSLQLRILGAASHLAQRTQRELDRRARTLLEGRQLP